ncbi:hypothetical protein JTE90_022089 [Oedothorax gibbosus]|uniref:Uncharacterized protein n=1 Tax=Oedothorax gibbosus TaxID=931172 RepID=A0AAV6U131_9ARAC|nr:hypothetical protein JTE90_022089 [Oedothorax gibbosus]
MKHLTRFEIVRKSAKILVVVLCISGFSYQALSFLQLYWTYPTVVDIQTSSPTSLDVPAFTICNPIGYIYEEMCTGFGKMMCTPDSRMLCAQQPDVCDSGMIPEGFKSIRYAKFLESAEKLSPEDLVRFRVHLEVYMNCTIEFAGKKTSCNLESVIGSYFTRDELPQFCYTIYSLWGHPHITRDRIPKGAIMTFKFYLNASGLVEKSEVTGWIGKQNLPTTPYVQIAVHSPYFLPSPYLEGFSYKGGKVYQMRITMDEKHLLPSPYQTSCTNYMEKWIENGGRGPINQLNVVQECRMHKWYSAVGCVPVTVDYPHPYDICGTAVASNPNNIELVKEDQCLKQAENFTQPCQSISYTTTREERDITIEKTYMIRFTKQEEKVRKTIPGHDCEGSKMWKKECSEIKIEILFDRFEITNLTYNPKIEQLELFSNLGGYMGMWLGISLVAVYDSIISVLSWLKKWVIRKRRNKVRSKQVRVRNTRMNSILETM